MPEIVPSCDLRILEQLSFKVVEASPDAKIVISTTGEIVIFNYQAELLFGLAREEVIGKTIEVLLPEDLHEKHMLHRKGYFKEPRVRDMGIGKVLKGKHRDSSLMDIEVKLAPLVTVGGVYALAVVRRVKDLL